MSYADNKNICIFIYICIISIDVNTTDWTDSHQKKKWWQNQVQKHRMFFMPTDAFLFGYHSAK